MTPAPDSDDDADGYGVLHEWLTPDGNTDGYVFGPFPTEWMAKLALAQQTCDCITRVIRVTLPNGIVLGVRVGNESGQVRGDPLLPDKTH